MWGRAVARSGAAAVTRWCRAGRCAVGRSSAPTKTVRRGWRPRRTVLVRQDPRSEGDAALDHEAVELAAIADVPGRELVVVLADVLGLEVDGRGDEPAGRDRVARGRRVDDHRAGRGRADRR